jgi:hypothetical protein
MGEKQLEKPVIVPQKIPQWVPLPMKDAMLLCNNDPKYAKALIDGLNNLAKDYRDGKFTVNGLSIKLSNLLYDTVEDSKRGVGWWAVAFLIPSMMGGATGADSTLGVTLRTPVVHDMLMDRLEPNWAVKQAQENLQDALKESAAKTQAQQKSK